MDTESLNRHLAEHVMGWKATGEAGEIGLTSQTPIPPSYYDPISCEGKGLVKDFDPPNNIEQAMGCLETFEGYAVYKNPAGSDEFKYTCEVYPNPFKEIGNSFAAHKSKCMAISLAIAKATGWKE